MSQGKELKWRPQRSTSLTHYFPGREVQDSWSRLGTCWMTLDKKIRDWPLRLVLPVRSSLQASIRLSVLFSFHPPFHSSSFHPSLSFPPTIMYPSIHLPIHPFPLHLFILSSYHLSNPLTFPLIYLSSIRSFIRLSTRREKSESVSCSVISDSLRSQRL